MAYERLEDLRVYQEATAIADEVWSVVEKWSIFAKDTLGKQLVRAADSISANIAESYGRTGTRDVIMFLIYSRGSMYETKDHLQKAIRRNLYPSEQGNATLSRLEALAPSLNAYISAKRRTLPQRPTT
ncbi:MAG: four helix bundle protein [Chloroflexi bacterium]|nr:four helix bundle protein [Chloroflexota bacterium]